MPSCCGQRFLIAILVACLFVAQLQLSAVEPVEPVDYQQHIKPLLSARCVACHGVLKQEAGLRLDTGELARQGSAGGAVIALHDAKASPLIQRISATETSERMPPEGEPLTPLQIQQLTEWISGGAKSPADERPEPDPREHWAFQSVRRPEPPGLPREWGRNAIDAFIAEGHAAHGLQPQTSAKRLELIRRLYIDLLGLPPTVQDWNDVARDSGAGWYERLVDRLLDDPRYGQRWARHWMDVWRYSDWWGLGEQLRNSQMHMWHWRDWIVESLNSDMPYDEMVRLMLAADELHPTDRDKLRATGFLARNYFLFNRHQWMDETVEHVSKGFLGLTTNCAKCHDHKYDPIEQIDYYRLRAFFEPYHVRLDMLPGEIDLSHDGLPRVYESQVDSPTYLFIRGQETQPDKTKVIPPGLPAIVAFEPLEIQPLELPAEAWQPERQEFVAEGYRQDLDRKIEAANKQLTKAQQRMRELQAAKSPGEPPAPAPAPFETFVDHFESLNQQHWQSLSGQWRHESGTLQQLSDGPTRSVLRLLKPIPTDFEATLKFTTLGGSQWRSVCLSFDANETDPNQLTNNHSLQTVYVSAVEGGSKLQGSIIRQGKHEYPSDAAVPRPIALHQAYTLRIQVRGTLINAYLNDEFLLAWNSPLARNSGSLQLETFDALAAFHSFEVKSLEPTVSLRQPGGKLKNPAAELADAERDVKFAELDLQLAQQEQELLSMRVAAQRADWKLQDAAALGEEQAAVLSQQAAEVHQRAITFARQLEVKKSQRVLDGHEAELATLTGAKRAAAEKQVKSAREALEKAQKTLAGEVKPTDKAPGITGAKWTATRFLNSGADDPAVSFGPKSSGRRTALAKWITDRRNPLTARVAVNHVWTRHFGTSLVEPSFDFGRKTPEPRHRELLDWMAAELMESGWSLKHLHRLIVSSDTYRLSSSVTERSENVAKDPDNLWLWRRNAIRIESQVVRDGILALAGTLDASAGGPPIMPGDQANSRRRSLYFFHSNNDRNLFLTTFDEAAVKECYRREQSIVPQQALALTNSQLVLDASKPIAETLTLNRRALAPVATSTVPSPANTPPANTPTSPADIARDGKPLAASAAVGATQLEDDQQYVQLAFRVILGIEPSQAECDASVQAMAQWRQVGDNQNRGPHELLVWALLNHNDFVTLR